MTYKEIIEDFESFANNHPDVAKFKSDTLDRMDDFSNSNEVFPMLYIAPISSNPLFYDSGYKATNYSFRVFSLVPRIDLEEVEKDNILNLNQTTTNLNQCAMILQHFRLYLDNKYDDVVFNLQPLNEFSIDRLQGWSADFSFEVANTECYG